MTSITPNGLELELMPGAMTIVLPETIDDERIEIVREGNRITISWSSILDRRTRLSAENEEQRKKWAEEYNDLPLGEILKRIWAEQKEREPAIVRSMPLSREERLELLKKCEGGWEDVDIETPLPDRQ